MLRRFLQLLALASVVSLCACGGVTQNVRAYRAYANEDPNIKVSIDRVEDLARTLELVDKILTGTTYTPGDMWPRRLPMTDAQFRERKAELRNKYPYQALENAEVPILKCYRFHIENAFYEYGPPPEKAKYPSLLDAVAALNPRGAELKAHWIAHRDAAQALADATEHESILSKEIAGLDEKARKAREPELAAARDKVARANGEALKTADQIGQDADNLKADKSLTTGDKEQIARDAFAALSVAFRIELEALALIPIIVIQSVRGIPTAPHDLTFKTHMKIVGQVYRMPSYVAGIKESFTRQAALLEKMTGALAQALHSSVEKSPGFELSESVVDQIVGITLDSFRLDLRAGGEAFIYSSIGTGDRAASSDNKTSYDYRGRQFKLDYRVAPIILANARLDLVLDWIRLPGAANLGLGYSTDRVYKSGGSVESSSFTDQLGVTGIASDVLDAALGVLGVRTSVKVATFTAGEVRQVQATDINNVVAKAPLQLKYTQVDAGYDILWLMNDDSIRAYMEELVIGARYVRYTLPRIVYELEDTSAVAGEQHFTFSRETPAQPVTSEFYMAQVSGRFGVGDAPRWSPFLDIGLAGGAGPTSFYFADNATTRTYLTEAAFVFNGTLAGGLRWRLLPRGSRLRLDLRFVYRGDMIYSVVNRSDTSPTGHALRSDFGSFDVFHGPSLSIRGAL